MFEPGGATIYPSAGSASAVTLGGGTFGTMYSDGVIYGPVSYTTGEVISGNATISLGERFPVSYGSSVTLKGLTLRGSTNGAVAITNGNLSMSDCVVSKNTDTTCGGITHYVRNLTYVGCTITGNTATGTGTGVGGYAIEGGPSVVANFSNCVISGNVGTVTDCRVKGTMNLIGGNTIGQINLLSGGQLTVAGSNKIDFIDSGTGGGSVTISSGAIIDLTGATNPTAMYPGTGITLSSGGVTIQYGSDWVEEPYERNFSWEIHGTTITNQGVIYGATVMVPSNSEGTLNTTNGDVHVTGPTIYTVTGGLLGATET